MNLLVIGAGYVGLTTSVCLADKGNNVICIDKDKEKIKKLNLGNPMIHETGLKELLVKNLRSKSLKFMDYIEEIPKDIEAIFVCVGTPEKDNGDAELKYVYEVIYEILSKLKNNCIIVVKSTVPVGECDNIENLVNNNLKKDIKIEIVSNPEFLAQGRAVQDTLEDQRIIIGAKSEYAINTMNEIYKNFKQEKMITTRKNAEMIKYASNSFLALKISYINSIADLCENIGADVQIVSKGMEMDDRIGKDFFNAGIGYGGSCFPKDTKALLNLAKNNGVELNLIKETIKINEEHNIILLKKAKKIIKSFNGVKVAILGLTFKPNTDDLREAPAIKNIEKLIVEGADITAYDPVGSKKCKILFPNIKYALNIEDAIEGAEICFIFTEWDDIKEFNKDSYIKLMNRPLIFDGRNCYDICEMKKKNIEYYSVGRRVYD